MTTLVCYGCKIWTTSTNTKPVVNHRLLLTSLVVTDSLTGERLLTNAMGQVGPIDVTNGGTIFTLNQEVEGVPRIKIHAEFENALALKDARSWPKERLDLILRQSIHDVEESLDVLAAHLGH